MKIVVFGSSGFVGGWIAEELSRREDVSLTACVRRWAASARIARRGIHIVQTDLDTTSDFSSLLAGASAVINAAVPPPHKEPELALKLYKSCKEAGVGRFVQFSSAAIYGNLLGEIDESTSTQPSDDYGAGKARLEKLLLQESSENSTQLIILRPSIIYGAFSDAWTVRYARRISRGRWSGLGRFGEGWCNLINARDVARAAIISATSEIEPGPHVVNINGPDLVTWNEYIRRFGDALAIDERRVPGQLNLYAHVAGSHAIRTSGKFLLSHYRGIVQAIGSSGHAGSAMMQGAKNLADLYPTFAELQLLQRRAKYKTRLAPKVINFVPVVSLDEGLREAAAWCRIHGVV